MSDDKPKEPSEELIRALDARDKLRESIEKDRKATTQAQIKAAAGAVSPWKAAGYAIRLAAAAFVTRQKAAEACRSLKRLADAVERAEDERSKKSRS